MKTGVKIGFFTKFYYSKSPTTIIRRNDNGVQHRPHLHGGANQGKRLQFVKTFFFQHCFNHHAPFEKGCSLLDMSLSSF